MTKMTQFEYDMIDIRNAIPYPNASTKMQRLYLSKMKYGCLWKSNSNSGWLCSKTFPDVKKYY